MDAVVKSPLAWGRGLKHGSERDGEEGVEVAPRVGAWIETSPHDARCGRDKSPLVWGRGLKLYIAI